MLAGPVAALERSKVALLGDVLRRFGEATVRVTGSSMLPSIWPGDVLTIRRRPLSEVRRRQIAVYTRHGRLVVHRVIAHASHHVVTQGDAVPSPDPPVREPELLGIVAFVSRNGTDRAVPTEPGVAGRLLAALVRHSRHANRMLQHVGRVRLAL